MGAGPSRAPAAWGPGWGGGKPVHAIGLMSGTSMDAVDAALVEINPSKSPPVSLVGYSETPLADDLKARIRQVMDDAACSAALVCQLNFELGEAFAAAAIQVAQASGVPLSQVAFIGSHGQTVCHIPTQDASRGWATRSTLQLGEPSVIAERTGVTTVADFRPRDVSAGGTGAPLMPRAERLMFGVPGESVVLLNIGGIANVTVLGADGGVLAYDTGPGNMVMDLICQQHGHPTPFDDGGRLSGAGRVNEAALAAALAHPFFAAAPPKSTGHEDFGAQFVEVFTRDKFYARPPLQDLVATACELTARSVVGQLRAHALSQYPARRVVISGGGAANPTLMSRLAALAPDLSWVTSDVLGIPYGAKEAVGFAVLGYCSLVGEPGNETGATGASHGAVLGKVVPGHGGLGVLLGGGGGRGSAREGSTAGQRGGWRGSSASSTPTGTPEREGVGGGLGGVPRSPAPSSAFSSPPEKGPGAR